MQTIMKNKGHSIRSKGFTLVELLIAMTLGFFLIAGIGTVYIGSKKTYKLQGQTAELDENARHAIRALKHHIAHAGYASTSGRPIPNYIIPTGADLNVAAATCADGGSNIRSRNIIQTSRNRNALAGDRLGLIFMGDENLATDCAGQALRQQCLPSMAPSPESRLIYNSFTVGNSGIRNSQGAVVPMLRCGGSASVRRRSLARGVESIQFLYGVDFDGDGSVDHYWNANDVEDSTVSAWDKIITVRVGLLMRSVEPVFDDNRVMTYQVLDRTIITASDRYKRGVYTTTVRLKNVAM